MAQVVELKNVGIEFRGRSLLHEVNLKIESGRAYGLIGPNGSGKSVLLRVISGLMRATTGDAVFDETILPRGRSFPDRFGVLIDGPGYMPFSSGFANLWDLARINGRISKQDVKSEMEFWNLDPSSKKAVRKYSLGMKQKLGLAQAFMEQPKVLILDEPFNALDQKSASKLHARLQELLAGGVAIVFTSHNHSDIDELAEVVYEISEETVVAARR